MCATVITPPLKVQIQIWKQNTNTRYKYRCKYAQHVKNHHFHPFHTHGKSKSLNLYNTKAPLINRKQAASPQTMELYLLLFPPGVIFTWTLMAPGSRGFTVKPISWTKKVSQSKTKMALACPIVQEHGCTPTYVIDHKSLTERQVGVQPVKRHFFWQVLQLQLIKMLPHLSN